jgi:hypothetical protein
MSYIGNNPETQAFTIGVEKFNGNGSCTQFQLSRTNISDNNAIEVVVSGSQQNPTANYSVQNGLITFNTPPGAPGVGVENIVVTYRAPVVVAFSTLSQSQVSANIIGETQLAPNAISPTKIQDAAITGSKLATRSVSGNNLGLNSVSGNNIGLGAISANNFAGGGITSNVLSQNLTLSVVRVAEALNINSVVIGSNSASGTNVNIDIVNTTVYYFTSNTTGNVTFNLRGNNINTFDSQVEVGNTVSVVITLRHNTAAGRACTNLMIDGGLIATTRANPDLATGNLIFFAGNTAPAYAELSLIYPATTLETNVIGINIFKKAPNSYFVLYSNTIFGLT